MKDEETDKGDSRLNPRAGGGGGCGRTLSVARPRTVKCPVVFVQSEVEPQVIAMTFVSMTRHVHVNSLLYLSGRDVLSKLKLYDYNGCPPFRDTWYIQRRLERSRAKSRFRAFRKTS